MMANGGFADFLRDTRASRHQTQSEAAVEVGVHRITWARWEQGLFPGRDYLLKIADWAGVTVDSLRPYFKVSANG